MPRIMTSAMATALSAPVVRLALLASLQFGDNTVYLWTGLGPATWSGMTFQGVGSFADISPMSEDSNVEAKNVTISLSGIPSSLMFEVLNETRILRTANIWLALYDSTGALISTPILSYSGKMDAPEMLDDGKTCTCTISLENVLVDLNREVFRRFTDEDQQMDLAVTLTRLGLPSTTIDTGFSHVAGLQEQITFWGRTPNSVNNV
jgi:hypothetical protein